VTESPQQERRIGILTVILVLLVVVLFWMLYPHKWPFRGNERGAEPGTDSRTVQLKKKLEAIQPLAGDEPGKIRSLPSNVRLSAVIGSYATKSDCATVETHYREEFAKLGLAYTPASEPSPDGSSQTRRRALSFSSSGYGASLSCSETEGSSRRYVIVMWSNARA
jgi:hypothetical protein